MSVKRASECELLLDGGRVIADGDQQRRERVAQLVRGAPAGSGLLLAATSSPSAFSKTGMMIYLFTDVPRQAMVEQTRAQPVDLRGGDLQRVMADEERQQVVGQLPVVVVVAVNGEVATPALKPLRGQLVEGPRTGGPRKQACSRRGANGTDGARVV